MTDPAPEPIAADLFTGPAAAPALLADRCQGCSAWSFPRQGACARCGSEAAEPTPLPRHGVLWTYTVQRFPPVGEYAGPTGDRFEPFGLGFVEFEGGLRIEGRLTESDVTTLRIGMPMVTVTTRFERADGTSALTYAFAPALAPAEQP